MCAYIYTYIYISIYIYIYIYINLYDYIHISEMSRSYDSRQVLLCANRKPPAPTATDPYTYIYAYTKNIHI